MKKILLVTLIIIFLNSCKKDEPFQYSSSLIGNWSWLRSCGGFAGCLGPEETHVSIKVIFTADSVYRYFFNDTLRQSSRFHTFQLMYQNGPERVIQFDSGGSVNYSITHDTLYLGGSIVSSYYKRIK